MCKAGYPKNGPDLWVSGHIIIKSTLKIFEFPKTDNVPLSEIELYGCLFLQPKLDFHLPTEISDTLKLLNHKCLTCLERVFTLLYDGPT